MKKALPLIAVLLVFLIGVGVLLYPLISSAMNNAAARQAGEDYIQKAAALDTSEQDRLFAEAQEYNDSLHRIILTDPFDPASYGLIGENYTNCLNMDDNGLIGYVDIPSIDVYLPIYHGTSLEVLSMGAGHLEHTALPIGGPGTHCVISAHSAWPDQTFFDYLETMKVGDAFYLHIVNKTLKYEVDEINKVLPEDTSHLYAEPGKDYCTLLTCTPYSVNTHRLLVRGKRVPFDESQEDITHHAKRGEGYFFILGYRVSYLTAGLSIGGFVLFVVVVSILLVRVRRRRKGAPDG